MQASGFPVWRLCDVGDQSLGLSCTTNGLSIGRTPLLEKRGDQHAVRSQQELERLLTAAYGFPVTLDSRMNRLHAVAKALNRGDLCLATISAVLLQLPDVPSYSARRLLEIEDQLLKLERGLPWHSQSADFGKSVADQFDPARHPRWPHGRPDGGEFRPADGTGANDNSPLRPISDDSDRHGIGGNKGPPLEEPPEIPPTPPASSKVRNALIRSVARWLAQALSTAEKDVPEKRAKAILAIAAGAAWLLVDSLANIASYLDNPKDLKDLQDAATGPSEEGYQDHHIVEGQYDSDHPLANSRIFTKEQLEGRDNIVRTPYWKHWEISTWYSTPNEAYGWVTPRNYLRGKSWNEQYSVGLRKLREYRVLK